MNALIISDYDCAYEWSIKELDGTDKSEEYKNICAYNLFNALDYVIGGDAEDFQYCKREYRAEFDIAMDILSSYDKVILCRNGNILIHDKEN